MICASARRAVSIPQFQRHHQLTGSQIPRSFRKPENRLPHPQIGSQRFFDAAISGPLFRSPQRVPLSTKNSQSTTAKFCLPPNMQLRRFAARSMIGVPCSGAESFITWILYCTFVLARNIKTGYNLSRNPITKQDSVITFDFSSFSNVVSCLRTMFFNLSFFLPVPNKIPSHKYI